MRKKGKEARYISARVAYKILGSVLADDHTKSLVYVKAFFGPRVFEDPTVSLWQYKFLP